MWGVAVVLATVLITIMCITSRWMVGEQYAQTPAPVYIISLPHRQDRLHRCIEHNAIKDYTLVEAVDGRSLEKTQGLTAGEHGCFLSHIRALQLIARGPHERGLVLEDDARLHIPADELVNMPMPPHTDMISVGCHWFPKKPSDPKTSLFDLDFDLYGAHAIVYTREGAQKILRTATLPPTQAYDIWVSRNKDVRKKVTWPPLADIFDVSDTDTQRIR